VLNLHVGREAAARDRAEPDQLALRAEDDRPWLDCVSRVGDDVAVPGIRIPTSHRYDRRVQRRRRVKALREYVDCGPSGKAAARVRRDGGRERQQPGDYDAQELH
jgi:hypothetical protein